MNVLFYICLGVLNSKTSSDYEGGGDVRNVQHSSALIKAKDLDLDLDWMTTSYQRRVIKTTLVILIGGCFRCLTESLLTVSV